VTVSTNAESDSYIVLHQRRVDPKEEKLPVLMLSARGQCSDRESALEGSAPVNDKTGSLSIPAFPARLS
jgi:hypothetical protein